MRGPVPLTTTGWLLVASATGAALAGCVLLRRRPLVGLVLLVGACSAAALGVDTTGVAFLHLVALDVALGVVVATCTRRTGVVAVGLALTAVPAYAALRGLLGRPLEVAHSLGGTWDGWPFAATTALVAWLVGNATRQSRVYAETRRAQAATQAVSAERLRIARELHDMVAHSIGIVALQAGAAARVLDSQPAAARGALSTIETTSRDTLAGMRRMLGALREDEPRPVAEAAPRSPGPGLADVDRLAATTTAAGVHVEVRWRGERRPLPPEIDLSAYRILQEALTNVVRHAGTRCCRVDIACRDDELLLEVLDRGHGGRGWDDPVGIGQGGHGLPGIRERVGLLHGEFSAGPRPDGGFRVAASLPLTSEHPAEAR